MRACCIRNGSVDARTVENTLQFDFSVRFPKFIYELKFLLWSLDTWKIIINTNTGAALWYSTEV